MFLSQNPTVWYQTAVLNVIPRQRYGSKATPWAWDAYACAVVSNQIVGQLASICVRYIHVDVLWHTIRWTEQGGGRLANQQAPP